MKHLIYSALFLSIGLVTKAQTTQTREITPINKIEVGGAATVYFTQSDTLALKVVAAESEIANIYTTIVDGVLSVKAKGSFKQDYKIYVSANHINQITTSGASKIACSNVLLSDSLSLDASGASDMEIKTTTKKVDVVLSGASEITLIGNSNSLQGQVSGASSLKSYKFITANSNITASGASSAKVFATEKINANATGSSTIKFKGEPKDVSAEASSSSSIAKVVGDDVYKQSSNENRDSTTFNFRKKKFVIINKEKDSDSDIKINQNDDFHHWGGFAMGVNGWLSNGNISLPKNQNYMDLNYGKSLNFQLNPFEKNIHIYKNYVNLVIGLGFEWNQYEFSNKTKLNADSSYTFGKIDSTNTFIYHKNRLKTTFVNIPLLVEFNTNKNPEKSFHVALGVIGGYKLGSRTRQILEKDNVDYKVIRKDGYNINAFRVNAHASVGYKNFTVFADYALTPLFEKSKGPELYPFTVGVKLVSF